MVQVANGQLMHSTHTTHLPITGLLPAATKAHVFEHMDKSLVGAGPLCDAGCTITLHKHGGHIQCPNCEAIAVNKEPLGL